MNSIDNCGTVHEFLEVYFKDGTADEKKFVPKLEEKIKSYVEDVFKKNQESAMFTLCIKDSDFALLGKRHITKVFGLAIKELHPECAYTLEDEGAFIPRGADFIALSCAFIIKRL